MAPVRRTVGAILAAVGLLIVGVGLYLGHEPISATSSADEAVALSTRALGPVGVTVDWSGIASGDAVYLTDAAPQCIGTMGIVRSGAGPSGSFSATIQPGKTYYLFSCTATGDGVATDFTYTTLGLSYLVLGGIVVTLVGLLVAAVPVRRRPSATPAPTPGVATSAPTSPPPGPGSESGPSPPQPSAPT